MRDLIQKILNEQREEEYDDDQVYDGPIAHMYLWKRQIQKIKSYFQVVKLIGNGVNGYVYELRDGNVLKITCDDKEATMSFDMMRNPHPHYVTIHAVNKFRYTKDDYRAIGEEFCYVIVMDKVTPLNKKEQNIAYCVMNRNINRDTLIDAYGQELFDRVSAEVTELINAFGGNGFNDLKAENMGRKSDGTLVAVDIQTESPEPNNLPDFNKEIDENLQEQ